MEQRSSRIFDIFQEVWKSSHSLYWRPKEKDVVYIGTYMQERIMGRRQKSRHTKFCLAIIVSEWQCGLEGYCGLIQLLFLPKSVSQPTLLYPQLSEPEPVCLSLCYFIWTQDQVKLHLHINKTANFPSSTFILTLPILRSVERKFLAMAFLALIWFQCITGLLHHFICNLIILSVYLALLLELNLMD